MNSNDLDRRIADALHHDRSTLVGAHDPLQARRRALAALTTTTVVTAKASTMSLGIWATASIAILAVAATVVGILSRNTDEPKSPAPVPAMRQAEITNAPTLVPPTPSVSVPTLEARSEVEASAAAPAAITTQSEPASPAPRAIRRQPASAQAQIRKPARTTTPSRSTTPTVVQEPSVEMRVKIKPDGK